VSGTERDTCNAEPDTSLTLKQVHVTYEVLDRQNRKSEKEDRGEQSGIEKDKEQNFGHVGVSVKECNDERKLCAMIPNNHSKEYVPFAHVHRSA
jgi:hypothetical protein